MRAPVLAIVCAGLTWALTPSPAAADAPTIVRYPIAKGRPVEVQQASLPYQALKLALAKAPGRYTLRPATITMQQGRQQMALAKDRDTIDVAWFGARESLEDRLKPVYIPIFKGLLGWRIPLIHRDMQARFDRVTDVADLRALTAIQGLGWPDTAILRHSGITVMTARYDLLPRILATKRVDWFPRSVIEIWAEKRRWADAHPALAIADDVLVVYRFAALFFVAPGDDTLHAAIRTGLERAHADGSFDRLFRSHPNVKAALTRGNLGARKRIDLPNPLLSDRLRAVPDKYWFNGPDA